MKILLSQSTKRKMNKYLIKSNNIGQRVDKALSLLLPEHSRSYLSTLIDEGHAFVNGNVCKASYKLKENDVLEIDIPEVKPLEIKKEDIPLDIVYEDQDILIINKPQGMVVHPSNGHYEHTLVNAILNYCQDLSGINGVMRPGIVHRIDKDTSGLICVAKNDHAHQELAEQLKTHTMARIYIALVKGVIKENSGTIDMPIGRDSHDRKKMAVIKENSKNAITNFTVIERFEEHTLIRCSLVTGRTHQIRVHMAYIGYPIEGDPLYSGRHYDKLYKGGQLLTAVELHLIHPTTKKEMKFETSLPQYFLEIIKSLRN